MFTLLHKYSDFLEVFTLSGISIYSLTTSFEIASKAVITLLSIIYLREKIKNEKKKTP